MLRKVPLQRGAQRPRRVDVARRSEPSLEAHMDAAVDAFLHDEARPPAAVEVASVKAFVERSHQTQSIPARAAGDFDDDASSISERAADDFDDDEATAPDGKAVRSAISTERAPDHIAPDGTELRELMPLGDGELWHATLDPGSVSYAVRHKQVSERWLFTGGEGELWLRRKDGTEDTLAVRRGVVVSIPPGVAFQFRSTSPTALEFFGRTTPKFPGPHEAEPTRGRWTPTAE